MKSHLSPSLMAVLFLLGGCGTTSDVGYAWFGTGVDNDWGTGGSIWSHFSSHSAGAVRQAADGYCSRRRLGTPDISPPKREGEYFKYTFDCQPTHQNTPLTITKSTAAPPSTSGAANSPPLDKLSFDSAKLKCEQLGFNFGSEQFGKCVLQLTK